MMYRIGAVFYFLWGVLHLAAAVEGYRFAMALDAGMVQGRLLQNSWFLAFFAILAILVAIFMNWRNSKTGYWVNLIAVSVADIGFILFILMPAYMPLFPGILGPVFWILAAIFSTLGLRSKA